MPKEAYRVLLIEDDQGHAELVKRAIDSLERSIEVRHTSSCIEALAYIDESNQQSNAELPHLILLDLKLPGLDGVGVLRALREREECVRIPIVVLSTSDAPPDVARAYAAGANAYTVKPMGFAALREQLQNLCEFWLGRGRG